MALYPHGHVLHFDTIHRMRTPVRCGRLGLRTALQVRLFRLTAQLVTQHERLTNQQATKESTSRIESYPCSHHQDGPLRWHHSIVPTATRFLVTWRLGLRHLPNWLRTASEPLLHSCSSWRGASICQAEVRSSAVEPGGS